MSVISAPSDSCQGRMHTNAIKTLRHAEYVCAGTAEREVTGCRPQTPRRQHKQDAAQGGNQKGAIPLLHVACEGRPRVPVCVCVCVHARRMRGRV